MVELPARRRLSQESRDFLQLIGEGWPVRHELRWVPRRIRTRKSYIVNPEKVVRILGKLYGHTKLTSDEEYRDLVVIKVRGKRKYFAFSKIENNVHEMLHVVKIVLLYEQGIKLRAFSWLGAIGEEFIKQRKHIKESIQSKRQKIAKDWPKNPTDRFLSDNLFMNRIPDIEGCFPDREQYIRRAIKLLRDPKMKNHLRSLNRYDKVGNFSVSKKQYPKIREHFLSIVNYMLNEAEKAQRRHSKS